MFFMASYSLAQPEEPVKLGINIEGTGPSGESLNGFEIIFLFTILTLAPSILIMMTSFTRIIIVLSFTRNALGTQQMPPNQVLIGLALFLTFFIMSPIGTEINERAISPYLAGQIGQEQALEEAMEPIRNFMFKQTREKDLAMFVNLSSIPKPETLADIPNNVLIPSFIISELKTAFQMGFLIYVPFIVVDMVVASTLMSMGMMMLPPVMISLPFKILLFVMVDGWNLVVKTLVTGFK
ncbi:MAG TPA: flagellar type III secretion system pore protein FliP [Clostridiales bacterium]|jgi:flagellar biosynthetic protein FliP|nr:flagellar type III secretion system pore protein FliP [Clostridiales bacterium]